MSVTTIYEPKGRALEYAPLALNLYTGCVHGCKYCFAPGCLHKTREQFHAAASPRPGLLESLKLDAPKYANDRREILLCFTCDPYQREQKIPNPYITREALIILAANQCRATILTKGGTYAIQDFDILKQQGWSFGTSLSFATNIECERWEPKASTVGSRVWAIQNAKNKGIKTWVSVEPVINPKSALEVIRNLYNIVDFWKVGKINHNKELESAVDWKKFLDDVLELKAKYNLNLYVKTDLAKYGKSET